MPQTACAPTYRAIAFARVRRGFVEDQANSPAMAASVMLAHPRISSTGRARLTRLGKLRLVEAGGALAASSIRFYAPRECPQWVENGH